MRKIFLLLTGLIFLLSLIPLSFAQAPRDSDGDTVPDVRDDCPQTAGPPSNKGCPVREEPVGPPFNPDDTDGDGNPNNADRCPDEGGPASNGGCPESQNSNCPEGFTPSPDGTCTSSQESTEQTPLPELPEDALCQLASRGRERVNVRKIPDMTGEVVGQLEPLGVYPVHFRAIGENSPEDDWFLVDLGWVSATVVRFAGYCRNVPSVHLSNPMVMQLGHLGLLFVGNENLEPGLLELPNGDMPTDQIPTDQLPPFLLQACDGSVRISWILQDFRFCDGSVMPTDQMPNAEAGSAFECNGEMGFMNEVLGNNDVSLEGILIGLLLPAVKMGDGSVMPINQFLGDGSVLPCPDTSLMGAHATGGGGGAGKVSYQDLHFIAYGSDGFGAILIGMPQEDGVGDPFVPFALNFGELPPDPDMPWVQLDGILIGLNQGTTFVCTASSMPDTSGEAVGFNPQPDPPSECVALNFALEQ